MVFPDIVTHSSLTLAPRPILTRRHDSSVGGATCQAKEPGLREDGDIRYDLKNPYPKLWFSRKMIVVIHSFTNDVHRHDDHRRGNPGVRYDRL